MQYIYCNTSPPYTFKPTVSSRTCHIELPTSWRTKSGLLWIFLQKSKKLFLKLDTLVYWATLCRLWLSVLPHRNTNWLGIKKEIKKINRQNHWSMKLLTCFTLYFQVLWWLAQACQLLPLCTYQPEWDEERYASWTNMYCPKWNVYWL